MLPPVFYVQQLEQILLRKLLSPPTPANPARFAFCPRRALISVFSFFVRFFRVEPRPLISRVCAVRRCLFLHPAPVLPAASALISIFSFLFSFFVSSRVHWSRASALRARRTYINIQFLSALSISGRAPLAPCLSYSVFSFFRFFSTRISAGFMIFSYGESTSNHL